ncbi:MAG: hypothetical protein ACLPN5_16000 [Roseiarcus sp.]
MIVTARLDADQAPASMSPLTAAIARAVYWDAKIVIMDEPTNNLGVNDRLIVRRRGRKVAEKLTARTTTRRRRDLGLPSAAVYRRTGAINPVTGADSGRFCRRGR